MIDRNHLIRWRRTLRQEVVEGSKESGVRIITESSPGSDQNHPCLTHDLIVMKRVFGCMLVCKCVRNQRPARQSRIQH